MKKRIIIAVCFVLSVIMLLTSCNDNVSPNETESASEALEASIVLFNEDGSLALVFNGEIYNFMELREELLAKGHTFTTRSDSEVLLHGFEEWGTALPEKLQEAESV